MRNPHLDPVKRMLDRIEYDTRTECWVWQGNLDHGGYGKFYLYGKRTSAHRAAHLIWIGPIPEGLQVDHLCSNRACVNPHHLEAVTPQVNTLRSTNFCATNAAKTHCKRGHEFTPENTYRWNGGGRVCKQCAKIRKAMSDARRRSAA